MCLIKRADVLPKPDSDLHEAVTRLSDEIGSFRCRRGFVIENFPETRQESGLFDSMISKSHVSRKAYAPILLTMPSATDEDRKASLEVISKRATGHMVHESSGRVYNSAVPELSPQVSNIDDITGETLVCPRRDLAGLTQSADRWWTRQEPEIKDYYGDRLKKVESSQTRDQVSFEISKILLEASSQ